MGLIQRTKPLGRVIGFAGVPFAGETNAIWWRSQFARATIGQHGRPASGGSPKPEFRVKVVPAFSSGYALDAGRDWDAPHQDVVVKFDAIMEDPALVVGGPATGHKIKINAAGHPTTYISGSGSNEWTFRVPVLVHRDDTILWSYNAAIGSTVTIAPFTPPVELATVSDLEVRNFLTKYIRFNLYSSFNLPVANEVIKIAVLTYAGGVATTPLWVVKQQGGITTTDSNGLVFILYTGPDITGTTVYVTVVRPDVVPTESMIWVTTVQ